MKSPSLLKRCGFPVLAALVGFGFTSCATADRDHTLIVSVPEQRLVLLEKGAPVASYRISTSRYGIGDSPGSYATPLGTLEVADMIGGNAPLGTVFKDRRPTGEVIKPNAPGRDPIVTRIIWLRGLEDRNRNAFARFIYIHGTPQENKLGRPASYGCIRMGSQDVADLFARIGVGAQVKVIETPVQHALGSPVHSEG